MSRVALGFSGLSKGPRALAAASAAFVRVLIIVRFFSASGGDFKTCAAWGALCISNQLKLGWIATGYGAFKIFLGGH